MAELSVSFPLIFDIHYLQNWHKLPSGIGVTWAILKPTTASDVQPQAILKVTILVHLEIQVYFLAAKIISTFDVQQALGSLTDRLHMIQLIHGKKIFASILSKNYIALIRVMDNKVLSFIFFEINFWSPDSINVKSRWKPNLVLNKDSWYVVFTKNLADEKIWRMWK